MDKAVVLVSGGIDSAVVLASALKAFQCHIIEFTYPSRSRYEHLAVTKLIAAYRGHVNYGGHLTIDVSLTELCEMEEGLINPLKDMIPGRNLIFLAYAVAFAETLRSKDIFFGASADDYSGFMDCRESFLHAVEKAASAASMFYGDYKIHTPLINKNKAEIIHMGPDLDVDFSETISCYKIDNQGRSCGKCHACKERLDGFQHASLKDPIIYIGDENNDQDDTV